MRLAPVPSEVQIAALSASMTAVAQKSRLLVCSGNHDLDARNRRRREEGGLARRGSQSPRSRSTAIRSAIGDTLFTLCPWWDGPYARARVERMLETRRSSAPAVGSGSITRRPRTPELDRQAALTAMRCCRISSAAIRRRRCCAGIFTKHRSRTAARGSTASENTWLFNAGRQIGDVPARIEIDFAQQAARWISLAGLEERALQ